MAKKANVKLIGVTLLAAALMIAFCVFQKAVAREESSAPVPREGWQIKNPSVLEPEKKWPRIQDMDPAKNGFLDEIREGYSVMVPEEESVKVENERLMENSNNSFAKNDLCSIKSRGIVSVVGIEKDLLLMAYTIYGEQYGNNCPAGVIFFSTKGKLAAMKERLHKIDAEERAKAKLLSEYIGK